MKIIYNKNPLRSVIELDEHEKEIFKMKIKEEELLDAISSAHFTLTHHEWRNANTKKTRTIEETIAEAVEELDTNYVYSSGKYKDNGLNERVNLLYDHYMTDLQGTHAGDCCCFACSCSKCHAEEMLGIDTMKGLGKHEAYKIDSAFGRNNEKSIDEVLEYLRTYEPVPPTDTTTWDKVGGWLKHVPRWKEETKKAYSWLLDYKNTHF
jgi:hypothetical protein